MRIDPIFQGLLMGLALGVALAFGSYSKGFKAGEIHERVERNKDIECAKVPEHPFKEDFSCLFRKRNRSAIPLPAQG